MTDNPLMGGAADHDSLSEDAMRWTAEPAQPADSLTELFGDVIHVYTRSRAIADGALIEVPAALAREAGLPLSVALTAAAWADTVEWSDEDTDRQTVQDETGRLWDVLWMTSLNLRRRVSPSILRFPVELYRVPRDGRTRTARKTHVIAEITGGDNGEPVLNIAQYDED
ncbi:DUF6573 family protein [Streptomyces sp. RKAG293]|uniref:DUF6573 family protein n=1 Tax=Streptomyces sp. RKAG293 TaxID=2893403 RepID=UPI0020336C83|nr:DUF6573 family protein [Streptomyces sp. RKAG293]MCM2424138.1 hypothetical protein [Streptomyces sp. RKAG293]